MYRDEAVLPCCLPPPIPSLTDVAGDAEVSTSTIVEIWRCRGRGCCGSPLFDPFRRACRRRQTGRQRAYRRRGDRRRRPSLALARSTARGCDGSLPCATAICRGPKPSRPSEKASWPVYQDYQELLERKDIDAVIVGTGEFQRVLPCIHACQAGKDIYAEKPLTLYIREGPRAGRRRAAIQPRFPGRHATAVHGHEPDRLRTDPQRRPGQGPGSACDQLSGPASRRRPNLFPDEPMPAGLDWDVWLNQAAWRPFNRQWMGWMRWRDFSGGEMTNWGAHGVDQIQWALGMDGTGPVEMWPLAPGPNGQVEMRYANGVPVRFVLEQRPDGRRRVRLRERQAGDQPQQVHVESEGNRRGTAQESRRGGRGAEVERPDRPSGRPAGTCRTGSIASATRQQPVADVEIGHRSISVCHLVNIARRTGRRLQWDPTREVFIGDDEASRLVDRPRRKGYELPALS